jgi:hypothetical protein
VQVLDSYASKQGGGSLDQSAARSVKWLNTLVFYLSAFLDCR